MDRAEAIKELMPFTLCDVYSDNLREACRMAIAALREQSVTDRHQWVSVKERLPDLELEEILSEDMDLFPCLAVVRNERARGGRYVTKVWYNGEIFMDSDCFYLTDYVTHWMKLPEPPKEGADHE